ncbi:S-adenosyl-L-methionine-dependent methyltransferase [Diplogelasinospora grovesii]|uniref:S-adenosyl-L-methionine-dependent methyltransferase n=1 Tax=Diplogelasinospora grovesii TaxID=303347 RepID=A0AAN6NKU7_9PEZI|nr:S-adenosyl-L-methionine-dependent methyltransferase [Diplogelasinospora grovesii]
MTEGGQQQQFVEEPGKLTKTFQGKDLSEHGPGWDELWKESYTPWDRGGPSLALSDLLSDHPELFPRDVANVGAGRRLRAFVPGCGRGHDVLLLSALGYDTVGLDFSGAAIREAVALQLKKADTGVVTGTNRGEEGTGNEKERGGEVTWLVGDFFDSATWKAPSSDSTPTTTITTSESTGADGPFDLIFDYTFFCALPREARPRWAARMSTLLTPGSGRLVCLEWPLHKPATEPGPPWPVTQLVYTAHLANPGRNIPYDDDGKIRLISGHEGKEGLKRLARIKPKRTHKAGTNQETGEVIDYISVWAHSE